MKFTYYSALRCQIGDRASRIDEIFAELEQDLAVPVSQKIVVDA